MEYDQEKFIFLHIRLCSTLLPSDCLKTSSIVYMTWSYKVFSRWAFLLTHLLIDRVGREFANDPGDLGSIPGRIIPKTLKWYSIPPSVTLSNIKNVSRVKWSNPGKGVAPSPTPRCSSYWKGSLLVALDYGRQLY